MPTDSRAVLSRPAPPPDFTVAYGDHPDQIADVRLPPGPGPLVIFIHGGFWRHEYDRTHTGPLATDLARRGYVVATVEYRRTGAPGGGWPGTFDDVAAAVATVPDLVAARTAVEPGRPVVAGHSAGGQLALWVALRGLPVRGVLALAPVADLRAAYDLWLDGGAVVDLLGGSPGEVPERYAAADPCRLGPCPVPVLVVHGAADEQVPAALSRHLASTHGNEVIYRELPGVDHFALIDPESAAWAEVLAALRLVTMR